MQQSAKRRIVASERYGGPGGGHWDDGALYDGVREIHVRYGAGIDSIGLAYALGGEVIRPEMHGGWGTWGGFGASLKRITLDYPSEYLINVSGDWNGAYWIEGKPVVIRSITFQTNVRTYGPYGHEEGKHFNISIPEGEKVIGFYGRSGLLLDAIGLHTSQQ